MVVVRTGLGDPPGGPEQISNRLVSIFPDDGSMRTLHEAIYSCSLCSGPWRRLKRETCRVPAHWSVPLRVPRARRRQAAKNFLTPEVNDFPSGGRVVDDRAHSGALGRRPHRGFKSSAIGNHSWRRTTRFNPAAAPAPHAEPWRTATDQERPTDGHGAEAVAIAIAATIDTFPCSAAQIPDLGPGSEMHNTLNSASTTGLRISSLRPA